MEAECGVPVAPGEEVAVKRARASEESVENNGNGAATAAGAAEDGKPVDGISTVIPGWFSEISSMWPGGCSILVLGFPSKPRPLLDNFYIFNFHIIDLDKLFPSIFGHKYVLVIKIVFYFFSC